MRIQLLPHARRAGIAPDSPVLMPRARIYPRRHDGRGAGIVDQLPRLTSS